MEFDPIPLLFYLLAVGMLVTRVYSGEKKHFLISILFVLFASISSYIINPSTIQLLFLIAIINSFIGDLLMAKIIRLTENRTVDGAIFFGVAHITYVVAFTKLKGSSIEWWIILLSLLFAIFLFYLIGYNKKLKSIILIVNFIYAILISFLMAAAISFVITPEVPITLVVVSLLGVAFFMLSDGILAYNEFKNPIKNAKTLIAVTYILAQILLQSIPIIVLYIF